MEIEIEVSVLKDGDKIPSISRKWELSHKKLTTLINSTQ